MSTKKNEHGLQRSVPTKAEVANLAAQALRDQDPMYNLTRNERRRRKKLQADIQKKYETYALRFIEEHLANNISGEKDPDEVWQKWDNLWRAYCRGVVNKNTDLYKDTESRVKLIDTFIQFVHNFIERQNKKPPAKALSTEERMEQVRQLLKIMGINTQAKTWKGLQKAFERVGEEFVKSPEYGQVLEILQSEL